MIMKTTFISSLQVRDYCIKQPEMTALRHCEARSNPVSHNQYLMKKARNNSVSHIFNIQILRNRIISQARNDGRNEVA